MAQVAQPDLRGTEGAGPRRETLVIGRVSENPKKHYNRLKTMVDYVASHLKDLGIRRGSVLIAKDNRQLIQYLKEGKLDWVTETPLSAFIFRDETGAEIMVRKWKKGAPEYHTLFFTRKDSGIESIEDLKGKKIAFEDPGSTTGYFVPVAMLKRAGLELIKLSSPREDPPPDKVGYAFARTELNISTWVHKRLAEAGAFSNLDWENPEYTPETFRKDLKVIYQSKPFPRAVELIRRGVDPKVKRRIKEILLKAHNDPKAEEALKAYDKTAKFDEFRGEAKGGLDEARQILRYIRNELR
ncbi:MAG: phosphate/phosphite/phosphonate ABC transporter substrate-binding protein [Candidatus Binatia bacterium]